MPSSLTKLLALSVLAVTSSALPAFLVGAAHVELSSEFGYGPRGLGLLTAIFFATAAVASAPLGRVVQRMGWKRAMRANALAMALLSLVMAMAPSVEILGLTLGVAGIAYGLANPAANEALAQRVSVAHRALVFGAKHAGIPMATLLAGLAVPVLILSIGWRAAFVFASVLAGVVAVLVPRGGETTSVPSTARDKQPVASLPVSGLITLGLAAALATWAAIALGGFTVVAAVDKGLTESAAGWLLFAGSMASISARLIAGHITDRVGGGGFSAIAVLTGLGTLVFLGLAFDPGASVFVLLVALAFGTAWAWPGLMTFAVVNANKESVAASSGVTQAGVFAGAGAGPVLIGWIVDRHGFDVAWMVVAAALALSTVLTLVVRRWLNRSSLIGQQA